ncbi:MAG TPA: ribonuclease P protein component, partial [Tepidisphaeraceae bacterium]|nr:ribonuclease P protein component [Tepidisphaeraceae bacterium]
MPARRYTLPRSARLKGDKLIRRVISGRTRLTRGPITLLATSNDLGMLRLGIRTPRAVGTAAVRNRIRRLLREAFRLARSDFVFGQDVMLLVRPHAPLMLADYQKLLSGLLVKLRARVSEKPE